MGRWWQIRQAFGAPFDDEFARGGGLLENTFKRSRWHLGELFAGGDVGGMWKLDGARVYLLTVHWRDRNGRPAGAKLRMGTRPFS